MNRIILFFSSKLRLNHSHNSNKCGRKKIIITCVRGTTIKMKAKAKPFVSSSLIAVSGLWTAPILWSQGPLSGAPLLCFSVSWTLGGCRAIVAFGSYLVCFGHWGSAVGAPHLHYNDKIRYNCHTHVHKIYCTHTHTCIRIHSHLHTHSYIHTLAHTHSSIHMSKLIYSHSLCSHVPTHTPI